MRQVRNKDNEVKSPLKGISLSKIKEFHGSYKSICDSFSINLTEFESIFSLDEEAFKIWDTD